MLESVLMAMLVSGVPGGASNDRGGASDPGMDAIGTRVIRALRAEPIPCPVHLRAFGAFSIGICGRLPVEMREKPSTVKKTIDSLLDVPPGTVPSAALAWTKEGYLSYRTYRQRGVPIVVQFSTGSMRDVPKGLLVFQYPQQFDTCHSLLKEVSLDETRPWTPPVERVTPRPTYPDFPRRARIEATVMLEVVIALDGSVSDACVQATSETLFDFDKAALEAVRKWRFEPATQEGVPVAARLQVVVLFGEGG